jgi:hypothetical protein
MVGVKMSKTVEAAVEVADYPKFDYHLRMTGHSASRPVSVD